MTIIENRPLGEPYRLLPKPKVVCLCGSTRFGEAFDEWGWSETLAGHIVLSIGTTKHKPSDYGTPMPDGDWPQHICEMLDELHWRKIDLADEVVVLDVDGYIGHSTKREMEYAYRMGKPIRLGYGSPAVLKEILTEFEGKPREEAESHDD